MIQRQQQIIEKIVGSKAILYLFLSTGLVVGLLDYVAMTSPGDDAFVSVFVNVLAHKIFEIFPYSAIMIVPISIVVWGFIGFVAYLIGRAMQPSAT